MQVFPTPRLLTHTNLKFLKTPLESFHLTALPSGAGMLGSELFEMSPNESGQSRVILNGDLSDFLDQFVVERKRDIHIPIIRETLIMGNLIQV
jgi:hypothetical protein